MPTKFLILDCETSIKANGNPFHKDNALACVDLFDGDVHHTFDVEYGDKPYREALESIKKLIESCKLLVGFNIKFDLHWIRRYIADIQFPPIWDCQLGEFILSAQSKSYPSLDGACAERNFSRKLDIVRTQYWDVGIDTFDVPRDILIPYLQGDTQSTYELFLAQCEDGLDTHALFKLQCYDLLCLEEMEFNGMLFDEQTAALEAGKCEQELEAIDQALSKIVPITDINWSSSDHISFVLYGGDLYRRVRVKTVRELKDGTYKIGSKWGIEPTSLPRLIEPLKNSEGVDTKDMSDVWIAHMNKTRNEEGKKPIQRIWSVDEKTLKSLQAKGKAKRIIELLLRRAEYKKLLTTYYRGIPEIIQANGWPSGIVHGQFNQCVARTGRLSSSKPNLQNQSKQMKHLFMSRY